MRVCDVVGCGRAKSLPQAKGGGLACSVAHVGTGTQVPQTFTLVVDATGSCSEPKQLDVHLSPLSTSPTLRPI